jgi:hypothetical protein
MHEIIRAIRHIPPDQLPTVKDAVTGSMRPAIAEELPQHDMVPLGNDYYSCSEQYHSIVVDTPTGRERAWYHSGDGPPDADNRVRSAAAAAQRRQLGSVLAHGDVRERHAMLPAMVRQQVLRADVLRAADSTTTVHDIVDAALVEQMAILEEFVGSVERDVAPDVTELTPLVDLETPSAAVSEARRLAQLPDGGIVRVRVPMAEVDLATELVDVDGIIPHRWAGE